MPNTSMILPGSAPQAGSQPAPVQDYPPLPRVGPIGYASVVDIQSYVTRLTIGPHLAGVRDVALWTTDQMRAYVDADRAARAPADSVTEDAARYRWLRRWKGQEHEPPFTVQHEVDGTLWGGDLDAAVDAARKKGANHD